TKAQRPWGTLLRELQAAASSTSEECIRLAGYRGRPAVEFNGVGMQASRAVWIIAHGDPGPREVLHSCNGGSGEHGCVNVRHLYVDTHARNMRDMVVSGRSPRGEAHGQHKLTVEEVRQIRKRRKERASLKAIAAEFGIAVTTVSNIVHRRRWAWLED